MLVFQTQPEVDWLNEETLCQLNLRKMKLSLFFCLNQLKYRRLVNFGNMFSLTKL